MSLSRITFSTPEGRGATLTFTEPLAPARLDALGEVSARILRVLDDDGPEQRARQAGEAEYASWFRPRAGEAEYASWLAQLRQ